jgi:hypothetical protein
MTRKDAAAILRTHGHHPSVTAQHLQKRLYQGRSLHDALHAPVIPRPKRWGSIDQAIVQYLQQQKEPS